MAEYVPPLRDMRFLLSSVVDLPGLAELEPFGHADPETVFGALEEFGRLMSEVWSPTNVVGDVEGTTFDGEKITLPPGFAEAYRRYQEAGWPAVAFEEDHGGGGFPWVVGIALQEMLNSANMALAMAPLLTQGAIDALALHGTEEQREVYLTRMVSGEWAGTMNLTEPEAGSDVGALRTRAVRQDDGTYRITGQKIFITFGDHELTDNIVHLVLARTPDAPPGTKGISLFLVPKYLVGDDGSLGARNDVKVVSIEHKMGIRASPTCVLAYGDEGEGAIGYLVGEEQAGMREMFTMMNNARLGVGVEGLGVSERAYQRAVEYAQERRQGRAPGAPGGERSLIVEHPDVRRMLLTMRSLTEAMRAMAYLQAAEIDRSRHLPDADDRARSLERVELLTPLVKSFCTDRAETVTSIGIQVHGGMGYIEETGVAQYYRDVKITQIYEGTNGIQAMDLVARKLPLRQGGVLADLVADMRATASSLEGAGEDLEVIRAELSDALDALELANAWIVEHGLADPVQLLSIASPYQRLLSTVVGGWLLARSALAAASLGAEEEDFARAKVVTARFYATNVLPEVHGLARSVTAGGDDLMALDAAAFATR
jgi:alkylation response protein AidB-like acyl-CoA dehydrogenase